MEAAVDTGVFAIPKSASSDACIDAALENIQLYRDGGSKPEQAFLVHIAALCMREADEWRDAELAREAAK